MTGERQRVEPADLAELKRLAEKATPGPWARCSGVTALAGNLLTRADWEYIAALSPDVVLALVERVAAAEQGEHEAQTYLDELRHIYEDQKREAVAAEARETQLREALNEVGPLMEEAMSRPLWGSLQGTWQGRARAWHKTHRATLVEVARAALVPPAPEEEK